MSCDLRKLLDLDSSPLGAPEHGQWPHVKEIRAQILDSDRTSKDLSAELQKCELKKRAVRPELKRALRPELKRAVRTQLPFLRMGFGAPPPAALAAPCAYPHASPHGLPDALLYGSFSVPPTALRNHLREECNELKQARAPAVPPLRENNGQHA